MLMRRKASRSRRVGFLAMARCIARQSSSTAQAGAVRDTAVGNAGNDRGDATSGQGAALPVGRSRGRQAGSAAAAVDPWDRVYQREQLGDVMPAFHR